MLRRAQRARTFTMMLADAHTQDFEKKRKPGAGDSDNILNRRMDGSPVRGGGGNNSSDDDDEDEQDRDDVLEAEDLNRRSTREGGDMDI
jgi:hypothetical protein